MNDVLNRLSSRCLKLKPNIGIEVTPLSPKSIAPMDLFFSEKKMASAFLPGSYKAGKKNPESTHRVSFICWEFFRGCGNILLSAGYLDSGSKFPEAKAKQNLDEAKSIVSYPRKVEEAI